jgi:hypothetical protein
MITKTSPAICLENDNGVVVVHRLTRQQYDQGDTASLRAGSAAEP